MITVGKEDKKFKIWTLNITDNEFKIEQIISIVHQFLKDNPKDLYKPSVALIRQSLLRAFGQYDIAGY